MPQAEGKVGELRGASGSQWPARLGPYGDLIASELHGRYFEQARLNRLFHSYVQAVTIAATHNSPIAAATATPVLGIHNPLGNTQAAVLLRVALHTVSGTPAGGNVVFNALQTTTAPTTPAGNIFAGLLSAAASPQGSSMRPFNNTALTGMLPVVGQAMGLLGGPSAVAVTSITSVGEDYGGAIVVPPGFILALMAGTGAGTTWIVDAEWMWEEIDWPLV